MIETASEPGAACYALRFVFRRPRIGIAANCAFHWFARCSKSRNAATLVTKRRRHTHFTVEHLIDARVAPEVIDVYRALIAEASPTGRSTGTTDDGPAGCEIQRADLLPGSVSRLNAFVPERMAQIEESLPRAPCASGSAGTRRKSRNSVSIWHKPKLATRRKSRSSALTWCKPKLGTSHKWRNSPAISRKPKPPQGANRATTRARCGDE